jgi:hypothetical protein
MPWLGRIDPSGLFGFDFYFGHAPRNNVIRLHYTPIPLKIHLRLIYNKLNK